MNCRTHEHRHFERTLRTVARPLSMSGSGSVELSRIHRVAPASRIGLSRGYLPPSCWRRLLTAVMVYRYSVVVYVLVAGFRPVLRGWTRVALSCRNGAGLARIGWPPCSDSLGNRAAYYCALRRAGTGPLTTWVLPGLPLTAALACAHPRCRHSYPVTRRQPPLGARAPSRARGTRPDALIFDLSSGKTTR